MEDNLAVAPSGCPVLFSDEGTPHPTVDHRKNHGMQRCSRRRSDHLISLALFLQPVEMLIVLGIPAGACIKRFRADVSGTSGRVVRAGKARDIFIPTLLYRYQTVSHNFIHGCRSISPFRMYISIISLSLSPDNPVIQSMGLHRSSHSLRNFHRNWQLGVNLIIGILSFCLYFPI